MDGSGLDRSNDFEKFCESGPDRIQFLQTRIGLGLENFQVSSSLMDRIRTIYKLQNTWDFFVSGLDWDIYFFNGSGYFFDFCIEISLRVIQDVTVDLGNVFFAMVFIFTKNQNDFVSMCCTHHINGNSRYFIVNFFRPSGRSVLLLYCLYAVLFVVLNGIYVCCVG